MPACLPHRDPIVVENNFVHRRDCSYGKKKSIKSRRVNESFKKILLLCRNLVIRDLTGYDISSS